MLSESRFLNHPAFFENRSPLPPPSKAYWSSRLEIITGHIPSAPISRLVHLPGRFGLNVVAMGMVKRLHFSPLAPRKDAVALFACIVPRGIACVSVDYELEEVVDAPTVKDVLTICEKDGFRFAFNYLESANVAVPYFVFWHVASIYCGLSVWTRIKAQQEDS